MSCRICGTHTAGAPFCMACGQPNVAAAGSAAMAVATREHHRPQRGTWLALQEIRLLACPRCGAPNSAARWRCARCGEAMDDPSSDVEQPTVGESDPADDATAVQPVSAPWLAVVTGVVSVATVAVALTMLVARGVGPFGGQEEPPALPSFTEADVAGVETSAAKGAADNLIDGNPATAWRVAGNGVGEWVEIELDERVQIDHLLIWNGAEDEAGTNRVRDVMITFPESDKSYKATFLRDEPNFRVDMEDPPIASRIQLEIRNAHGDESHTGLSGIQALTNAPPPTDED
jgi:DNA-directed RNA polymerase subunit RPC12/RpoP